METEKTLDKNGEKFEYTFEHLKEISNNLEKKLPRWAENIIANIDPEDTMSIKKDELNKLPPEILKKLIEEAEGINAIFSLLNFMPEEHETDWHQFGIIDHSKITVEWLKSIVEKYPVLLKLHNKEIVKNINNHFQEKIGDKTKKDLFVLSGYLHDIGKFATRKIEINEDGSIKHKKNGELKFSFKNHEKKSGEILEKNQNIRNDLMDMGLTEDQIDYLAQCSKLHFELGILRNVAKTWQSKDGNNKGFCPEFVNSPEFYDGALDIISEHPKYTAEIGIFYLADTLSKHRLEDKTPDTIEQYLEKLIKEENLKEYQEKVLKPANINNDNILEGIKQIPINIIAARKYFDICMNDFEGKLCQIQILDKNNTLYSGSEELSDLFLDELSKISKKASTLNDYHHGLVDIIKDMVLEINAKIAKKIGRELGKGDHYLVDDDFVNNILDKQIKIKTIRENSYESKFTSIMNLNGFEIGITSINTYDETVDIKILWDDEDGYKEKLHIALQSLIEEVIEKFGYNNDLKG